QELLARPFIGGGAILVQRARAIAELGDDCGQALPADALVMAHQRGIADKRDAAAATPGTRIKARSTVAAQPPQNMPSMAKLLCDAAAVVTAPRRRPRAARRLHSRGRFDPRSLRAARRRNPP